MLSKIFLTMGLLGFTLASCAQNKSTSMENNNQETTNPKEAGAELDTATFAEGCFWCTESFFQQLKGVKKVVSGYSGGNVPNPTYEEVCSGTTGYAEACNVIYDPAIISFDRLLAAFWESHDPTTLNRQGNDIGTQYRSAIFYRNETQKEKAESYKEKLNKSGAYNKPIVTSIEPYKNFYPAENYHQNFYVNNPNQPYCQFVLKPKLEKFRKVFKDELK